jgi:uroporphyrinogen III methyltransferase / synthase
MAGKVFLVGAGPGDASLLTLKGKRCLEHADVVIYDYLANPRLLDYARPDAERLLVGKHGGGTRVEQPVINAMLIAHARQGKVVVRLKGGDPFLFGRGAEEAEAVRAAGLEFEIVPGVSSVTAVPAYAGIPLTHRDRASSVIVTTGYEYPDKAEPVVRWSDLARSGSTLVVLMTQRQLRSNMAQLLTGGLPPDTPAALIEWGTRIDQRTIVGTVADIADRAEAAALKPPALAVVGEVVRLRERLSWFEDQPLFGRRIVITRPRRQAIEFTDMLEGLGAEVVPFPTIETVPPPSYALFDAVLARAREFDWVVFTSVNGVRVFFERLRAVGGDVRDWSRARVAAIGSQTARALGAFCVRIDAIPEEFRAEALVTALQQAGVAGARVLLPRAGGARDVLPVELTRLGATVEEVVTYETVCAQPANVDEVRDLLDDGRVDLVTFTSSSTVHNFVTLAGNSDALRTTAVGCIGPVTADTARSYGMRVVVQPEQYTVAAFADAIVHHFQKTGAASGAPPTGMAAAPHDVTTKPTSRGGSHGIS